MQRLRARDTASRKNLPIPTAVLYEAITVFYVHPSAGVMGLTSSFGTTQLPTYSIWAFATRIEL